LFYCGVLFSNVKTYTFTAGFGFVNQWATEEFLTGIGHGQVLFKLGTSCKMNLLG